MKIKMYTALLMAACLLPGCTFFQKNQVLAMVVVQQATTRYIEQAPDKPARAAAVRKVAEDIKRVAESDKVSIDGLKALALKQIEKAQLKPSDALLANTLVEASVAALLEKVKTGELDADAKVAVNKLIDWVRSATALY
jgi:hypothetical protein